MNLIEMKTALEAQQKALAELTQKVGAVEAAPARKGVCAPTGMAKADSHTRPPAQK